MVYKYEEDFFNIFDFLILLFKKKLTLISFVIIGISISFYFKVQNVKNQSEIIIRVNNEPTSYKMGQVLEDFKKVFYKKETFDRWKNNRETLIKFDNIRNYSIVDNILTTRPDTMRTVQFKNEGGNVVAKLNVQSLEEADEIFNYLTFLNKLISKEYYNRLIKEKNILENIIFGDINVAGKKNDNDRIPLQILDNTLYNFLGVDRFISQYNQKELIFEISRPLELSSSRSPYIYYIIVILFLILGIIFITFIEGFKNHLKKNNHNLDK